MANTQGTTTRRTSSRSRANTQTGGGTTGHTARSTRAHGKQGPQGGSSQQIWDIQAAINEACTVGHKLVGMGLKFEGMPSQPTPEQAGAVIFTQFLTHLKTSVLGEQQKQQEHQPA